MSRVLDLVKVIDRSIFSPLITTYICECDSNSHTFESMKLLCNNDIEKYAYVVSLIDRNRYGSEISSKEYCRVVSEQDYRKIRDIWKKGGVMIECDILKIFDNYWF